jgi:ATP-dependent DNA helicase RecG
MDLKNILEKEESSTLEFKEKMSRGAYETISAFANSSGGTLICGISDKGEVIGLKLSEKSLRTITDKIANNIGIHPKIDYEIQSEKNFNYSG